MPRSLGNATHFLLLLEIPGVCQHSKGSEKDCKAIKPMTESCDTLLSIVRTIEPFGVGGEKEQLVSLSAVLPRSELRNGGVESLGLPHQTEHSAGPCGPGVAQREPLHQPGRVGGRVYEASLAVCACPLFCPFHFCSKV